MTPKLGSDDETRIFSKGGNFQKVFENFVKLFLDRQNKFTNWDLPTDYKDPVLQKFSALQTIFWIKNKAKTAIFKHLAKQGNS